MSYSGPASKDRVRAPEDTDEPTDPSAAPTSTAHLEVDGELAPGTLIGEYRVEARLGQGGMATVYRAVQPVIGKGAAIKVLSAQLCSDALAVDRFVQEARAVNQIGHPNIVDVFAFGKLPDGRSYCVMELLAGETLQSKLRQGPMAIAEVVAILFQICDGLAAAHDKGIVHRDLKPENLFLCPVRNRRLLVKILDFGVAKLSRRGQSRVDRTAAGSAIGTPNYMSPEQARGKEVDHRADVYSLGVTAFEMVTGRLPYQGEDAIEVLYQHVNATPPAPSSLRADIPLQLERLILQMMEKKPENRPTLPQVEARLVELRETVLQPMGLDSAPLGLRALESGEHMAIKLPSSPSLPTMPRSTQTVRALRSRPPMALVAASVAILLASAGAAYWRLTRPVEPPAPAKATAPVEPPAAPVNAPVAAAAPKADEVVPGTLLVHVDAPDAQITVDGEVLSTGKSAGSFAVEPGDHSLSVTAPHRKPFHRAVSMAPGATVDVVVTLEHVAAPPAPRPKATPAPKPPKHGGDKEYMLDPFGSKK